MTLLKRRFAAAAVLFVACALGVIAFTQHTDAHSRSSTTPRASAPATVAATTTTTLWAPTNPVLSGDFPDPDVITTDHGYFAFSTNPMGTGPAIQNVAMAWSSDLRTWTRIGDALPRLPRWAAQSGRRVWAPSVVFSNGEYVMAVTLFDLRVRRECIGIGTSPVVTGPYSITGTGPLVCQSALGGSIDPDLFIDRRGVWLLWKSDENSIGRRSRLWSAQLSSSLDIVGTEHVLLTEAEPWEKVTRSRHPTDATIEAPSMLDHNGIDYLVYSGSAWDSANYAMGWARCASPAGPCVRAATKPFLQTSPIVAGPGGGSPFMDRTGHAWLAYHGWDPRHVGYAAGGVRSLRLARVAFVGDLLSIVRS